MLMTHSSLLRYGVAVLTVALALLLTLPLKPWLEHNDFLLFFPALMLSAWYGGIGPGLLATFLSLLAIDFFVLPPVYGLNLSWDYIPRLGAFAFVAALTSWLTAARKQAEVALRATHDSLEQRVEERTAELSRANAVLEEQIAERARAEEALRESEELHRITLSRISDAVFITEEAGAFTYICPNAEVIFGYTVEEAQALGNIKRLIGAGFFDRRELDVAGEIQNIEREVEDKAGSRHSILMNVKRVSIKGGSLLYTCRDITGRKQAESRAEALKQSDALKSALIASVSHDLRTPLTSIRASVDSLLHHELDWDQAAMREFHVIISEEVNRLIRLVENLLAMARIDAGELRPLPQWGSVAEICNNVLDRCAGALHHHRIRVDCAEDLPLVRVDSRLVAQALANLIENAAKHSPPASEIVVWARLEGNQLLMSVSDEGPGIAQEDVDRIFDKFYRGRYRPERQNSGTGMGLAIARGIIEAHGGRIQVESKQARGATFTFALPVEIKERIGTPN